MFNCPVWQQTTTATTTTTTTTKREIDNCLQCVAKIKSKQKLQKLHFPISKCSCIDIQRFDNCLLLFSCAANTGDRKTISFCRLKISDSKKKKITTTMTTATICSLFAQSMRRRSASFAGPFDVSTSTNFYFLFSF